MQYSVPLQTKASHSVFAALTGFMTKYTADYYRNTGKVRKLYVADHHIFIGKMLCLATVLHHTDKCL